MKNCLRVALIASAALVPTSAYAETAKLKPIVEARLRYENVDQDGILREADALTLRMRAGFEIKKGDFAVLAEGEATLALSERYNSGLNGNTAFPIVADPETVEINRIQLQYTGIPKTVITAGRQRINLDDQRFVGTVLWRQNEQTFDAARVEYSGIKNVKADLTYAWSTRPIWGSEGFGARQRAIGGDNVFANLSYKAKTWGLTGFAYLVDQDEAAVQNFRNSSQTFGVRGNANLPIGKAKLGLIASYARQSDLNRNPNDYGADYLLGEATLGIKDFKLTAGYEVLGADAGVAFTSFQTPLATLHKFNGFADKFLTTPPNGIRDLYLGAGYNFTKFKTLPGLNLNIMWHQYKSDRLDQKYGDEWNVVGGFKIGKKISLLAKYANYNRSGAANFAGDVDTEKYWVQLDYAL
ncbi:MAG: alginate export family protein [Sphingomonadaceae bacterium]|nr:alginate export family protein [Sphingomonadaceae bacterium]